MNRPQLSEEVAAEPKPTPQAGLVLGKYRLFAAIGSGGMATVYLAVAAGSLGFNKIAVVKRLRPTTDDDSVTEAEFLEMFLDEARLASRLNHPNIVHTYEVGEAQGGYFIAMEYLEGQPLRRILRDCANKSGPVPRKIALRIILDALAGLEYAHELRDYDGKPIAIIHRDISPANIFVTYDGTVKLFDFGIAKASINSSKTQIGHLKGKAGYMAPEQIKGGEIDRRADLFAMAVVFWEMLAGKRLFGGDLMQSIEKMIARDIPLVSSVVTCDPELDAIVAKGLDRDPDARFQTAEEMRKALDAYVKTHEIADAREVGKYVSETFHELRESVRKRIEAEMSGVRSLERESSPDVSKLPSIAGSGVHTTSMTPPRIAMGFSEDGSGSHSAASIVTPHQPGEAKSKSRAAVFALGALVLCGLAVGGTWFAMRGTPSVQPLPSASPPQVVAAVTAEPPKGPESKMTVTVLSDPAGATVSWNDKALGDAPVAFELPVGTHVLTLSKQGFEPATTTVEVSDAGGAPLIRKVALTASKTTASGFSFRPGAAFVPRAPAPTAKASAPVASEARPVAAAAPPSASSPSVPAQPAPTNKVKIIDDGHTNVRIVH